MTVDGFLVNQNHCSLHGYFNGDENTPCPRCAVIKKKTSSRYEMKSFVWLSDFEEYLASTQDNIISSTAYAGRLLVIVRKP